jgi:predicted aldo/keto reductase-like oxidoreductase
MVTRSSKNIPLELPRLGYGCMRMPTLDDGKIVDRKLAIPLIDRALEAGINYFDTGFGYHGGDSEKFLGEALSGRYERSSYYLATKMPPPSLVTREKMEETFAHQLKRLKTEYIDFYLIHAATRNSFEYLDETHKYFSELKKRVKSSIWGFPFMTGRRVLNIWLKTIPGILS